MIMWTLSQRYSTISTLFIIILGSIPGIRYRLHLGKLINSLVKEASRKKEVPRADLKGCYMDATRNAFGALITCNNFFSLTGMIPFLVWIFIISIRLFPQRWNCNFVDALGLKVKLSLVLNFYWTCSIFSKFHNLTVPGEERLWACCYREMLWLNLSNTVMFFIYDAGLGPVHKANRY